MRVLALARDRAISSQYTKEIRQETDYSATWLPNTTVKPGDVGRLRNYEFVYETTLKKLGIGPSQTEPCATQMNWDYQSENCVSINVKASGEATIAGSSLSISDAGLTIKFSRNKATLFCLKKCTGTRLRDLDPIKNEVLSRYQNKKWDKDRVVVIEAVKAGSATIIISKSSNAQIDLAAKGKANLSALDLADVNAQFQMKKSSNLATQIIASKGLTPLFRAVGVIKHFLEKPKIDIAKRERVIISDSIGKSLPEYGDIPEKPTRVEVPEVDIVDYEDFK